MFAGPAVIPLAVKVATSDFGQVCIRDGVRGLKAITVVNVVFVYRVIVVLDEEWWVLWIMLRELACVRSALTKS